MIPKSIRNSMKNRYKKHARKKNPKYEKLIKKIIQKWTKIHQKSFQKSIRKKEQKKSEIPEKTLARRDARNPQTQSFQKNPAEENTRRKPNEGWVQGGVQKVECKRHLQKGKCRQGTHYARKHARWPATTCGLIQVPTARFRTWSQRMIFE